jgi:hypothetical protein
MMAEAGPYGITQFDVAGVVGAYQQSQANRIQMMIAQKQMERIDKETKNEDAASKAVSAYYSPTPNASGAAPTTGAAPGTAPGAGPAMPNAAARQKLIGTLMAIDPATAEKYMNVMAGMDKDQATRAAQTNAQIMQVMGGLLQLPPEQRKAAIQQQAPQLQQLGYTPRPNWQALIRPTRTCAAKWRSTWTLTNFFFRQAGDQRGRARREPPANIAVRADENAL